LWSVVWDARARQACWTLVYSPRRNEHLGPLKASRHAVRLRRVQHLLELGEVIVFLILDVVLQVGPDGLERRDEVGVSGCKVLELLQLLLDLRVCSALAMC